MAQLTRILLDKSCSVNIVYTKKSVFIHVFLYTNVSLYTIIYNWSFRNTGRFFFITMEV